MRTAIIKQATHVITRACQVGVRGMEGFAEKVLMPEGLLKQISSGNKVVAELAHESIFMFYELGVLALVSHTYCGKNLPVLLGEAHSRSSQMRAKLSEYISIMLENYPREIIDRNLDYLIDSISTLLADADPDARYYARISLARLADSFPEEASKLVASLNQETQKQLTAFAGRDISKDRRSVSPPKRRSSSKTRSPSRRRMSSPEARSPTQINTSPKRHSLCSYNQPYQYQPVQDDQEYHYDFHQEPHSQEPVEVPQQSRTLVRSASRNAKQLKVAESVYKEFIQKFDHPLWSERYEALRNIMDVIITVVQSRQSDKFPDGEKLLFMSKIIEKFEDHHAKVQETSLTAMMAGVPLFKPFLPSVLYKIIAKISYYITDLKESQKKSAIELLWKLNEQLPARELLEHSLKAYHSVASVNSQLACLDIIASSLESLESQEYSSYLVKSVISRICGIFKEKSHDKKVCETVMRVIKTSLHLNDSITRSMFAIQPLTLQSKVLEYAEKYEPQILVQLNANTQETYHHLYARTQHLTVEPPAPPLKQSALLSRYLHDRDESTPCFGTRTPDICGVLQERHDNLSPAMRNVEQELQKLKLPNKDQSKENYFDNMNVENFSAGASIRHREISDKLPSYNIFYDNPSSSSREGSDRTSNAFHSEDRVNKIKATLAGIKESMDILKTTGTTAELQTFHVRAFTYLVQVIMQKIPEIHSTTLSLVESTFLSFDSWNHSYQTLFELLLEAIISHKEVAFGSPRTNNLW
jgi:hypothetical protein